MRTILAIAIIVVLIILITSCTSSHVYVSTGDGARAGKRDSKELNSQMDTELNTSVVGIGKSKIVNPK